METMPADGEPLDDSRNDMRFFVGSVALALFWFTGSISGFLFGIRYGFVSIAACSLVVSYFLGSSA